VEIGKLQLLQSLYLYGTRIKELPSSIVELRQLMFLSVDSHTSLPYGLRYLTSLEQLATVRVDFACTAEELGHLTQLRVLAVDLRSDKADGIKTFVQFWWGLLGNCTKSNLYVYTHH